MMLKKFLILSNICLVLGFISCDRIGELRKVPVPSGTSLRVEPFGMDNILGPIGNHKVFDQGLGGIFVYHVSTNEYVAYDMACPNDYEFNKTVSWDDTAYCLRCKNGCGTKFDVFTGVPLEGENPSPLYTYRTYWNSSNQVLTVFN